MALKSTQNRGAAHWSIPLTVLGPNLIKIALIVLLIVGLNNKNNIGDIPGNDRSCIYHNRSKPIFVSDMDIFHVYKLMSVTLWSFLLDGS